MNRCTKKRINSCSIPSPRQDFPPNLKATPRTEPGCWRDTAMRRVRPWGKRSWPCWMPIWDHWISWKNFCDFMRIFTDDFGWFADDLFCFPLIKQNRNWKPGRWWRWSTNPRIWNLGASLCLETSWLALCASFPRGGDDDELHPVAHGLPGWETAWCVEMDGKRIEAQQQLDGYF